MTKTANPSLQTALDQGLITELADLLKLMKLGTMLTPLKRTFTGLTGAATYDLTALDATGETVGAANTNRVPALVIHSLVVVTATTANTQGVYVVGDPSITLVSPTNKTVVGTAKISDDGKTLTFPTADVTAFTIEYMPRSLTDMTTIPTGSGIGFSP